MKVHQILEFWDKPAKSLSGTVGQALSMSGSGDLAPEILEKFKEEVKKLPPEDQAKVKEMGGIKPFWNEFKRTAKFRLDIYKDRGVLTLNHPITGKIETTINLGFDELGGDGKGLDIGKGVRFKGATVKRYKKGGAGYTSQSVTPNQVNKVKGALDAELSKQGIDPKTGIRK